MVGSSSKPSIDSDGQGSTLGARLGRGPEGVEASVRQGKRVVPEAPSASNGPLRRGDRGTSVRDRRTSA